LPAVPPESRPSERTTRSADNARKIADTALDQLAAALKEGRSEKLKNYLAVMARFHRYSFGNILMILFQMPSATHVAGFHSWKQLGRYVKKGEHGIVILAPMLLRDRSKQNTDGEEQNEGQEQQTATPRRVLRFRGVFVFDVSQTEGKPLPEPATVSGNPGAATVRLRSFIAERGIALDHEDLPAGALGVSRGGRISIREGLTQAEEFATLTHECAHELLHHGQDAKRPASKTVRETEAEAVAFVVCTAAGLATGTAASDYIQLHQGDADLLAASLDRIQKTAAAIIAAVLPAERNDSATD
jgi:hypothetical protein